MKNIIKKIFISLLLFSYLNPVLGIENNIRSNKSSNEDLNYTVEVRDEIKREAVTGEPHADFALYQYYINENDKEQAFHHLQIAANRGEAFSQMVLALHYGQGDIVDKDLELAKVWTLRCANQGVGACFSMYARLILETAKVPHDFYQAYYFLLIAHDYITQENFFTFRNNPDIENEEKVDLEYINLLRYSLGVTMLPLEISLTDEIKDSARKKAKEFLENFEPVYEY